MKVTSFRLSDNAERAIRRIVRDQSRPGLRLNRTQAVEIALAMYAGAPRCPECATPLEPITLAEDGSETGFWRCPECTTGDTFAINPKRD